MTPGKRPLARRVDVRQEHEVSSAQRGSEFLREIPRPRKQVGLKRDDDAAARECVTCRRECRTDFSRVVRVVVDDGHLANFAKALEPAFDACETLETRREGVERRADSEARTDPLRARS